MVVGDPYGNNESIRQYPNNAVGVRGWAIDPDTAASINVHFYRGLLSSGIWLGSTTANVSRPDVGAAYPGYGNNHGFNTTITMCAYAINHTGPGDNPLLQCRTIPLA